MSKDRSELLRLIAQREADTAAAEAGGPMPVDVIRFVMCACTHDPYRHGWGPPGSQGCDDCFCMGGWEMIPEDERARA